MDSLKNTKQNAAILFGLGLFLTLLGSLLEVLFFKLWLLSCGVFFLFWGFWLRGSFFDLLDKALSLVSSKEFSPKDFSCLDKRALQSIVQLDQRLKEERALALEQQKDLEKELFEAKASDSSPSEFVANMSHELRAPLNSIVGFSDVLFYDLEKKDYRAAKVDAKKVHDAAIHLLGIINATLDLAKMDAGRMEVSYERVSVKKLMAFVSSMVQGELRRKNNEFILNCPLDIGHMVVDPLKLRQILLNILSNAAKFTENGKVIFSVSSSKKEEKEFLEFSIEDTGLGIPFDKQKAIFDRFVQLPTRGRPKAAGSGLGLSITRKLCEALSGEVFVESSIEKGSLFRVSLPRFQTNLESAQKGPVKVLFVDDDSDARQLWREYLTDEGYQVFTAESGEVALLIFKDTLPDILVTDLVMPGMMGHDLVRAVLELDPLCGIVATTGKILDSKVDEELQKRVHATLIKPFDPKELLDCLAAIVKMRQKKGLMTLSN